MATIKKGTYRWKEEITYYTFEGNRAPEVNIPISLSPLPCTFNGISGEMSFGSSFDGVAISTFNDKVQLLYFLEPRGEATTPIYFNGNSVGNCESFMPLYTNGWEPYIEIEGNNYVVPIKNLIEGDTQYYGRTFTVTSDTTVTNEEYDIFSLNTEPVSTEVTEATIKSKIQSLITKANTTTGKSDTDLTGAVLSLAEGYGQGDVAAVNGKWRFNETVEKTSIPSYPYLNITQNVNFTTTIEGTVYQCTGMWVSASNFYDPTHLQYQGDSVPSVYGFPDAWLYDSARNVDFGAEPQIVDPDFKDWLLANATRISSGEDSPLPIEVATESEMNTLLTTAEVGSVYKYTGETTDTYESGALYVVEEVSE